ncbi:MAG: hypothetical protein R3A45_01745 [Bdellovibrionota bacterium]
MLETTDQLGQKNRLEFSNSVINSTISDTVFDYQKVKKTLEKKDESQEKNRHDQPGVS